jgi:hypothetical protein
LFVITKKFNGTRLSSVEHQDGPAQMRYLASLLREISEDPRLSISIEVKPCLLNGNAPALPKGKSALSA